MIICKYSLLPLNNTIFKGTLSIIFRACNSFYEGVEISLSWEHSDHWEWVLWNMELNLTGAYLLEPWYEPVTLDEKDQCKAWVLVKWSGKWGVCVTCDSVTVTHIKVKWAEIAGTSSVSLSLLLLYSFIFHLSNTMGNKTAPSGDTIHVQLALTLGAPMPPTLGGDSAFLDCCGCSTLL